MDAVAPPIPAKVAFPTHPDSALKIDLFFPVRGTEIAQDHGYLLYSAISRLLEHPDHQWLHQTDAVGLHLIRGRHQSPGRLQLGTQARLGFRIPAGLIHAFFPLAGTELRLADATLRLGQPHPEPLRPAPVLLAERVTTRNGQDEARFDQEIARQMAELGIRGEARRGPRRVFAVKDKRVVAHTLLVSGLTADESLRLQEQGLGGRRKMGCGVFLPWRG